MTVKELDKQLDEAFTRKRFVEQSKTYMINCDRYHDTELWSPEAKKSYQKQLKKVERKIRKLWKLKEDGNGA